MYVVVAGPDTDGTKLTWMGDLGRWNYLIGFGLIFLGLASPRTRPPRSAAAAGWWSGCSAAS